MPRDYRDTLIEDLVDRELALRTHWQFERAMFLDQIDRQRDESARLRAHVARLHDDTVRYTRTAVAGGRRAT